MVRGLDKGQKSALIVNEMQRGVVEQGKAGFSGLAEQVAERNVIGNIVALAAAFRARGLPVFHCHVVRRPDFRDNIANTLPGTLAMKSGSMKAGSEGAAPVPGLEPHDEDFALPRTHGLGVFYGTALDSQLRRMGVQTIVATGVSLNIALPGIAIGATDRGYQVIIPEDCAAAASAEAHTQMVENQLKMLATMSTKDAVIAALG